MDLSFEQRVLSAWRVIVARLAPFLALAIVLAPMVACVKCDYSTSHGICVTNGETNRPSRQMVEATIDEAIAFWSQHYELERVQEALRWTWVRFYDDRVMQVPGEQEGSQRAVRGFTAGRWIGVMHAETEPLLFGVLRHELGHVNARPHPPAGDQGYVRRCFPNQSDAL